MMNNYSTPGPLGPGYQPPPQADRLPAQFEYLQHYTIDMAYTPPPTPTDSRHTFKWSIYATLLKPTMNENQDWDADN